MDREADGAPTPARFYRPELDALRFFAFLAVFLHHALPQNVAAWRDMGLSPSASWLLAGSTRAGGFGVSLFFLLSSYLITELLLREEAKTGRIAVVAFYVRRALRIWPLYYLFLAAATLGARWLPGEALPGKYLLADAVFLGNWAVAFRGYPASITAPLWSISVEEQFYVAWPLLLALASLSRVRTLCVGLLTLAVATRLALTFGHAAHPALWCNTLAQLDPIALGALLAFQLRSGVPRLGALARGVLAALGVVILVGCGTCLALDGWSANLTFPAIAIASLLLLVATLGSSAIARPSLIYLGRISYGLYVVHVVCIDVAKRFLGAGPITLAASLLLTIAVASVLYHAVERPFLRIKRRFATVASRED